MREESRGILPLAVTDLFRILSRRKFENLTWAVYLSAVDIAGDKIRDLAKWAQQKNSGPEKNNSEFDFSSNALALSKTPGKPSV